VWVALRDHEEMPHTQQLGRSIFPVKQKSRWRGLGASLHWGAFGRRDRLLSTVDEQSTRIRMAPAYSEPWFNSILHWAYRSHVVVLVGVLIAVFNVLGLLLGTAVFAAGCAEGQSFAQTFVLAVGQFVSLGEEDTPRTSNSPGCVYLTLMSSVLALLLQAFVFALFVSRVLNPTTRLFVPNRLVCEQRDDTFYLSFRVVHTMGHHVSHLNISAVWVEPRETAEGVYENRVQPLAFRSHPDAIFWPRTMLIPLEGSALEAYTSDLTKCKGSIIVSYSGYDETLRTGMYERQVFAIDEIAFGSWTNLFPPGAYSVGREPPTICLEDVGVMIKDDAVEGRMREYFAETRAEQRDERPLDEAGTEQAAASTERAPRSRCASVAENGPSHDGAAHEAGSAKSCPSIKSCRRPSSSTPPGQNLSCQQQTISAAGACSACV